MSPSTHKRATVVGVPREIKNNEFRVALIPAAARELFDRGHTVLVETGAGLGIGIEDAEYTQAGATVVASAEEVFAKAELVVKVKEPQAVERARLRPGQTLFTYLHLAPDLEQTQDLLKSGATCIAYETVTGPSGGFPLLAPMSEVAGRMSIQAGARALERSCGGRGMLLGGVPGVSPAKVVIIGGGMVGSNAAQMACGMRADVTVLDRSIDTLRRLDATFAGKIKTVYASRSALEEQVLAADLVIGGVYLHGSAAPKLVTRDMVAKMKTGSVLVDVAIDQGGCFETSKATTHSEPTYVVDGVVHYCVANMPGAVPRTSTFALNNVTQRHILALADHGPHAALSQDTHLRCGLNVYAGKLTCEGVAKAHSKDWITPEAALEDMAASAA